MRHGKELRLGKEIGGIEKNVKRIPLSDKETKDRIKIGKIYEVKSEYHYPEVWVWMWVWLVGGGVREVRVCVRVGVRATCGRGSVKIQLILDAIRAWSNKSKT